MKYRGHVRNGVVILDGPPSLAEGLEVLVEPAAQPATAPRGTAAAILQHAGTWSGEPAEIDRFLEDRRRENEAEMEAEKRQLAEADDAISL